MKYKNIDETIIEAFTEYTSLSDILKQNLELYSFKTRKTGNINFNLEKLQFSSPSKGHLSNSYFVKKINNNNLKENKKWKKYIMNWF